MVRKGIFQRLGATLGILAMLASCGGGEAVAAAPAGARRRGVAQVRRLRPARCSTGKLGRGAAARMVSVPRDTAGDARSGALWNRAGLYRRADRDRPQPAARPLLHLHHLDRRRERLFRYRLERRLRRSPVDRRGGAAGVHRRGVRGRAGAGGGDRSRRGDPGDRHQQREPAHRRFDHRRGRHGGRDQRARAEHRGNDAAASDPRCRRDARAQRHQGQLYADAGLLALRRADRQRRRAAGRLPQPQDLYRHRRSALRNAFASSAPPGSPTSSSICATMAAAWSRLPS